MLFFQTNLPMNFAEVLEYAVYIDECLKGNKYKIDNALFEQYLIRHCPGFSIDLEGLYNINYLIIVLLANWQQHGLLSCRYVYPEDHFCKAIGIKRIEIHFKRLRRLIVKQMEFDSLEEQGLTHEYDLYHIPLWGVSFELLKELKLEYFCCKHKRCIYYSLTDQ